MIFVVILDGEIIAIFGLIASRVGVSVEHEIISVGEYGKAPHTTSFNSRNCSFIHFIFPSFLCSHFKNTKLMMIDNYNQWWRTTKYQDYYCSQSSPHYC